MIDLRPMTSEEYAIYLDRSVAEYAEDKVKAGNWAESEALERSRKEFATFLPEGKDTADMFLCSIIECGSGQPVGIIWYGRIANSTRPIWFIYDFYILEDHRRRGYAMQALKKLESLAAGQGIESIGLHVFGHNTAARTLYERAGFEITNINMSLAVKTASPGAG